MRRAHRLLLLQVVAGAAVVWLSTMGDDAVAKTKKKGKGKGKTAASASASASAAESASAAASASAAPSAAPVETAVASASAAPSESSSPSPASSASDSSPSTSADTGSARPTGRDVMLEGVGGLIFGAVPLLAGSAGLLLIPSGATDKTTAYIGLGIGAYAAFIPMTALGVSFAGHLLDVHGTYLGALIGTTIGSAVAAAPTAVLVYEGTRGASVDGIMVMTSLFAFPMVLGTIGGVIGWEVSVSKGPPKAALRRWIFPGVTPSPYGATLTLSGAF